MELVYLPSTNPENATLRSYLAGIKQVNREDLPNPNICKFTFMMTLSNVLNNTTEALILRNASNIVGLIQLKMNGNSIFIYNFCSILKGSGATLLNKVIEIARMHKLDISLSADEFGGDELIQYYERFGFVNTAGNNMVLKAGYRKTSRKINA